MILNNPKYLFFCERTADKESLMTLLKEQITITRDKWTKKVSSFYIESNREQLLCFRSCFRFAR